MVDHEVLIGGEVVDVPLDGLVGDGRELVPAQSTIDVPVLHRAEQACVVLAQAKRRLVERPSHLENALPSSNCRVLDGNPSL